jgi:hypothetical protein
MAGKRRDIGAGPRKSSGAPRNAPRSTPKGPIVDDAALPSGEDMPPGITAIDEAIRSEHEHAPHLAAALLETVSSAAIQVQPSAEIDSLPALGSEEQDSTIGPDAAAASAAISDPVAAARSVAEPAPAPTDAADPDAPGPAERTPPARVTLFAPPWLAQAVDANLAFLSHLQNEGVAALAHLSALSRVTSPTDFMALQTREIERATEAALGLPQHLAGASDRQPTSGE